jgi:hypothetical protein
MRWFAVLSPLLLVACSSGYQIPQSHVEAPHASIGVAEQQGVASVPDASARLSRAKQELDTANRLASRTGRTDRRAADLMYLRADADARVASAIAQSETSVADTQRIDREAQQIQTQVRNCTQAGGQAPGAGQK